MKISNQTIFKIIFIIFFGFQFFETYTAKPCYLNVCSYLTLKLIYGSHNSG